MYLSVSSSLRLLGLIFVSLKMFQVTANPLALRFPTTLSLVHYREHVRGYGDSHLHSLRLYQLYHWNFFVATTIHTSSYGITASILASTTPLVQSSAPTISGVLL